MSSANFPLVEDTHLDPQNLLSVLDAFVDGIYEYYFYSKETRVSPNFYRIMGYEPNEFLVTDEVWDSMIHPDDLEEAYQPFYDHVDEKAPVYRTEYRMKCKDGSYQWMSCSGKIIEYDENGPVRLIGAMSNIHARKQIEIATKEILHASNTLKGTDFFKYLTRSLAELLDMNFVIITSLENGYKPLSSLTMWEKGRFIEDFAYQLEGTPCKLIYSSKKPLLIDDELYQQFPEDPYLKDHLISTYYGVPFMDMNNNLNGHLFVMNEQPYSITPRKQNLVNLYAQTAGAVLDRTLQRKEIVATNTSLEKIVEERTRKLEEKNQKLKEYLATNSHIVRAPIVRILGLLDLFKDNSQEHLKFIHENLHASAKELDDAIRDINKKLSSEEL